MILTGNNYHDTQMIHIGNDYHSMHCKLQRTESQLSLILFLLFNVVFAVTVLAFWLVGCIFLVVVVLVANVPAFMLFHPLVHSVLVLLFYFMFSPEAE